MFISKEPKYHSERRCLLELDIVLTEFFLSKFDRMVITSEEDMKNSKVDVQYLKDSGGDQKNEIYGIKYANLIMQIRKVMKSKEYIIFDLRRSLSRLKSMSSPSEHYPTRIALYIKVDENYCMISRKKIDSLKYL